MTTMHRPRPIDVHPLWYAALAVIAGIVLALGVVVLQGRDGAPEAPSIAPVLVPHVGRPSQVCFATPHDPSIELLRAGCTR